MVPGALTVVILTFVAVVVRGSAIEDDLTSRASSAFEMDGTPWAVVSLNGRDATLTGTAPTEASRSAVISAADRVWGIYTVDETALELLPIADPYTLEISKSADDVTISGSFPNAQVRTEFLDGVRAGLSTETLVDETALARGAPIDFESYASFAAASVSNLSSGTVALDAGSFSLDGVAASLEAYDAEQVRLGDTPAGLLLASVELAPPFVEPFSWSAEETDAGIVLSGFVPSEEGRLAIVESASAYGEVNDQMQLASGAPEGFVGAAQGLLSQFEALDTPGATITDLEASLTGDAKDDAAFASVNGFLNSVPDGFDSISGQIRAPLVDPFTTRLEKTTDGFMLTGYLPDETSRALILDALSAQGVEVVDTTTVARGAPDGIELGAAFAASVPLLAELSAGAFDLGASGLQLTGETATFQQGQGVLEAVEQLKDGSLDFNADITTGPASPFEFTASTVGAGVELVGYVPTEEKKDAVLADVDALFPQATVLEELHVADGAPE
ncbi:MAG: BON domain-containing protein, partial [Bacteroidota bacterium]